MRAYTQEFPDVIGFRQWWTVIIECKISRADFLADAKKPHRVRVQQGIRKGMGNYRLYACPTGLIKPEELPEKWGLLYFSEGGRCKAIINPLDMQGAVLRAPYVFDADRQEEMNMMYSALRRLHLRGRIPEIYGPGWQE
ncbi:hypothetical protein [Deinococcus cellulosilyticus]